MLYDLDLKLWIKSLNISDFILFFTYCCNLPLSQQPPCQSSPLPFFENLLEGSTPLPSLPPPQARKDWGGVHTVTILSGLQLY